MHMFSKRLLFVVFNMTVRRRGMGFSRVVALVLACVSSYAVASEAIVTSHQNTVHWSDNGRITGIFYATEVTCGAAGNFWPDFDNSLGIKTIGQTFRCRGPRLVALQLGADDTDVGYEGLNVRDGKPPMVTVRLFRGGRRGQKVLERVFEAKDIRPNMLLKVDLPSTPDQLWYVEYSIGKRAPSTRVYCNATANNTYNDGQMYINGRLAKHHPRLARKGYDPDLMLRITRSWNETATRKGRAVLWAARPEKRIWMEPAKTMPLMLADDPSIPFGFAGARNERVSCQLTVSPCDDYRVNNAMLDVGPFVGPDGARIETDKIRIEWLRYTEDYRFEKTSGRLYPDPLATTNIAQSVNGEPDKPLNRTFWVSMKIPADAKPGMYNATAKARVNGKTVLTRQLRLKVYNLTLPTRTHTRTALFRVFGGSLSMHKWWIRDLAEFRIAIGSPFCRDLNSTLRGHKYSESGYDVVLGKEMQRSLVESAALLNELGLDVACVTPWADTYRMLRGDKAGREGVIRFWKTYYPLLKKHGLVDQVYCRLPDELKSNQIGKTRPMVKLFREFAPGVQILMTPMGTPDKNKLMRGVGLTDIWCPSLRYIALAKDFYNERQKQGEKVWPYIHDFTWHPLDTAACRMYFWMLRKNGFDGVCYFSVKRARFEDDWFGVKRYTDTWPGDGDLYYDAGLPKVSVNGMWRSARLYRIGDGLEDIEYFHLLDEAVTKVRARKQLNDSLAQRIAVLKKRSAALNVGVLNFSSDMAEVEDIRQEIVDLINVLSNE